MSLDNSSSFLVTVGFTANGDVSDYDLAEQQVLLDAAARVAGFTSTPPGSTITITSASVNIEITFPVATAEEANAAQSTLGTLTTPAAVSNALSTQIGNAGGLIVVDSVSGGVMQMESGATAAFVQRSPLSVSAAQSSGSSGSVAESGMLFNLVIILSILLGVTTLSIVVICYLRGHFGVAAKLSRMPSVRRVPRPKMVKLHGVAAAKAPEGFGLPLEAMDVAHALTDSPHFQGEKV